MLLKRGQSETILETISREKCTIVWLLVPWALDILEALDNGSVRLENYELSQWRLMHIGAQPVPPEFDQTLERIFPESYVRHQLWSEGNPLVRAACIWDWKIFIR